MRANDVHDMEPVSVVLLAHNEAEVIEDVARGFYDEVICKLAGSELIVAEDGSTDGTKEILGRLSREMPQLRWIEGKQRLGYVNAYKKAMTYPRNPWIVFCDCSGKHDPRDFWKLYALKDSQDLIIGYKERRADPFYRVILGKGFNVLVNWYFGTAFKDIDCPLRLMRKSAFAVVSSEPWIEKALINFEVTLRFVFHGYRVTQVPIKHFKRASGPSRGLPPKKILGVVLNVLKNFPEIRRVLVTKGTEKSIQ